MEAEVVVVGLEEVGLLPKTELGQGATGVGEEVQVVLGQHLVSKRKKDYIKDFERKGLILSKHRFIFSVYEKLILVSILFVGKRTLQVSAGENILIKCTGSII